MECTVVSNMYFFQARKEAVDGVMWGKYSLSGHLDETTKVMTGEPEEGGISLPIKHSFQAS